MFGKGLTVSSFIFLRFGSVRGRWVDFVPHKELCYRSKAEDLVLIARIREEANGKTADCVSYE